MPQAYPHRRRLEPNAFATGVILEHAAAGDDGIIRLLSARELRGVMAHELAHAKHRDILIFDHLGDDGRAIPALPNFAMFFGGRD